MTNIGHWNRFWIAGTALLLTLFLGGCANKYTGVKDPFYEKWETMAKTNQGNSPAPRIRDVNVQQLVAAEEARLASEEKRSAKPLPKNIINLKMRQADVKAVLRALARAANQNILVKNDLKGDITVDFNNIAWNEAFIGILRTQSLDYIWEGEIIRVMSAEDKDQELKRKSQERDIKWVEPLLTILVPIDYATPKELRDNLEAFLTKDKDGKNRGSVRVDEHSSSLIIQAIREDLTKMMPIIEKLDKPSYQVRIKANIVETTKEVARQLGIQWGGMYGNRVGNENYWLTPGGRSGSAAVTAPPSNYPWQTSVVPQAGQAYPWAGGNAWGTNWWQAPAGVAPMTGGYTPSFGSTGVAGHGMGINFPADLTNATGLASLGLMLGTIGGNILELQLNALQKDGKVNILSSPSITTLDNQKAFTENGEKVPVTTRDSQGNPSTRYEDASLKLEITPHVIDGKNLKMNILVKKDEVDVSRRDQLQNPYILKKQTETALIVTNGETIVISGLSKHTSSGSDTGIPGFKDIPILGWLAKSDALADKMEEVLIFITPTILPPPRVADATPDEGTGKQRPAAPGAAEPTRK